jgi:hypothetical protein
MEISYQYYVLIDNEQKDLVMDNIYTVKPLDNGHSRSPTFCPLFGGVRYSEKIHS